MKATALWMWMVVGLMALALTVGCGDGKPDDKGNSDKAPEKQAAAPVDYSGITSITDLMTSAAKMELTDADVKKLLTVFEEVGDIEDVVADKMKPGAFDFPGAVKAIEGHATSKAALDRHNMQASEFMMKVFAVNVAMQALDPRLANMMKAQLEMGDKAIASMKAKPGASDADKARIAAMEKNMELSKKMIAAIESVPQVTIDAVKANESALKQAMMKKKAAPVPARM